jgi:hypothetical protein
MAFATSTSKAKPKSKPVAGLLEKYQKARAMRQKHSALEDVARARITAKGYEIADEYGSPGGKPAKMKLRPMPGLKGKK